MFAPFVFLLAAAAVTDTPVVHIRFLDVGQGGSWSSWRVLAWTRSTLVVRTITV